MCWGWYQGTRAGGEGQCCSLEMGAFGMVPRYERGRSWEQCCSLELYRCVWGSTIVGEVLTLNDASAQLQL